jgi:hypothetical protein
MTNLYDIAHEGLLNNMFDVNGKTYIVAGNSQFYTIWVRDFCFCMDILINLGLEDLPINLVKLYLKHLVKDSKGFLYGPKCFDSENPELRTIKTSVRHVVGLPRIKGSIDKLVPHMYKDSRQSKAIDSNILICTAAVVTNQSDKHFGKIIKLLKWYRKDKNGLILQHPFSDFQDSQRREGLVFNSNLLYYICLKKYKKYGYDIETILGVSLPKLKKQIIETFYDPKQGLFISQPNEKYICLLDNLQAIKHSFIDTIPLYNSLKKSKLWTGSELGFPGFPCYPNNYDTHIQVSFGGLNNYHNDLYWGWLMAFSGTIAYKMKDILEGDKMYYTLTNIAMRDNCVAEVYSPTKYLPIFESLTYSSERPFSMSILHCIELCKEHDKLST